MITRRKGERIYVGEIEIIVSEIAKSNVRLAVRAPAGQLILRGEVKDSIEAQNRAAASSQANVTESGDKQATPNTPPATTDSLRNFVVRRK